MNFTPSQLPATLNTVEKVIAWCGMLLHRANGTLKVIESPGFSDYAVQVSIFQADDGTQRMVVRVDLELDAGYAESGSKMWTQIKPFSDVAIPSAYLT